MTAWPPATRALEPVADPEQRRGGGRGLEHQLDAARVGDGGDLLRLLVQHLAGAALRRVTTPAIGLRTTVRPSAPGAP